MFLYQSKHLDCEQAHFCQIEVKCSFWWSLSEIFLQFLWFFFAPFLLKTAFQALPLGFCTFSPWEPRQVCRRAAERIVLSQPSLCHMCRMGFFIVSLNNRWASLKRCWFESTFLNKNCLSDHRTSLQHTENIFQFFLSGWEIWVFLIKWDHRPSSLWAAGTPRFSPKHFTCTYQLLITAGFVQ